MNNSKLLPIAEAILAAALFGASSPLSKLLLRDAAPVMLTGLLYLGCGIGLCFLLLIRSIAGGKTREAGLKRSDFKWLAGSYICGGILAPIILMISLQNTPASTASLLLNFETAATTLIAAVVFKEALGKRVLGAVLIITLACALLSFDFSAWGFSAGALGILAAALLWGADNNFTRSISAKDPVFTVMIKGFFAGAFSLILAFLLGQDLPSAKTVAAALFLGFVCYGISITLYILAMRSLGAARASAFYGAAPFAGAILSFLMIGELPGVMFYVSLPLMIVGALLIINEQHVHAHLHEAVTHDHSHRHDDGHHLHTHNGLTEAVHSHEHSHPQTSHSHPHTPDIHHRHSHESE